MNDAAEKASLPIAGIDVGGTFTDIVLFDPVRRALQVAKVPSTPADQSEGVLAGLQAVLPDLAGLGRLVHGTTVSTNAVLQRSTASVAMVTSAGFRDVLEIGRTRRMLPSLYDTTFVRPPPMVPRPLRLEVGERVAADGTVLVPLDEAALLESAEAIAASGAEAVAVCFLHAYANPAHERRALRLLQERLPGRWVTASCEVVSEFREYERFSTTVINASLMPVMDRYLETLSARLGSRGYRAPVFTMSSAGGTMDLASTRGLPVRTILSGPAGGVAGATWIAELAGVRDFITCDMGGTSTDVCLIENGKAASVTEAAFFGYPIKGQQVDINTVGAGGGSIAFVEDGNMLKVGPRSAGAVPGPAAYDRGGHEPTVPDANIVVGRLGGRLLGGSIRLHPAQAERAVQALAERLGVGSAAQMAQGIVDVATAQMADAIREISIERGYDPADFTLMAFGGAGPMHAVQVAEELGMTRVLIPVFPGNLSALGLLASDQRHELVQTFYSRLAGLEREALAAVLHAQRSEGSRILAGQGFPMERVAFAHALDMRYARQGFELTVAVNTDPLEPAAFQQAFLEAYTARFGQADATGAIEIVNVRTTVIGRTPKPELPRLERSARLADAAIGQHPVVVSGETLQAAVYERARLPLDERLAGPAIVEEEGATTVVLPGWSAGLDRFGNLHLRAET